MSWLVISVLSGAMVADACSCTRSPTTCESVATAEVAFIGTVLQGTDDGVVPRRGFMGRTAVVALETVVRGLPGELREVRVNPAIGTSCTLELKPGQRWLILGWRDGESNLVRTHMCTGSRDILPGDTEIRRIVDSYRGGANLFIGNVRRYRGWDSQWRSDNFEPDVEVKLSGTAGERSLRTDKTGRFEMEGLAAGEYRFTVSKPGLRAELLPDRRSEYGKAPDKIVIPQHGCVQAPILMWPDTQISGRVQRTDGQPVAGLRVVAFQWGDDNHPRVVRSVATSEDGRYVLPRLPVGRYSVGIRSESGVDGEYPATFYPSAPSQNGATLLEITDGKAVNGIDFQVSPARKRLTVRVRVVWPDQRPARLAIIRLEHAQTGEILGNPMDFRSSMTDAQGFATIRVYEGTEYLLSATWQKIEPQTGVLVGKTVAWHSTNRVRLIGAPDSSITLVLRETPDPQPLQ
jgi:hypothetical protein